MNLDELWQQIVELARDDPAAYHAVRMVRYRSMSIEEAALHLAINQTKGIAVLREELSKAMRYSVRPVVAPD